MLQDSNPCKQGSKRNQAKFTKTVYAKYRTRAREVQGAQNTAFHTQSPSLNQTAGTVFPVVLSGCIPVEAHQKFPETCKLHMVRKVSLCRSWISCSFSLKLTNTHGSKENIMNIKTSSSHSMLVSQPNSKIIISASSAQQDLPNHGRKLEQYGDRNSTYLKCNDRNSRVQASSSSRSTPLCVLWSFVCKEFTKTS